MNEVKSRTYYFRKGWILIEFEDGGDGGFRRRATEGLEGIGYRKIGWLRFTLCKIINSWRGAVATDFECEEGRWIRKN